MISSFMLAITMLRGKYSVDAGLEHQCTDMRAVLILESPSRTYAVALQISLS